MLSARDRRVGAVSNVNKSTVRQGQQESSQSSFETCSPASVQEELRPFFSGTVLRRMWTQCSQSSLSRHRLTANAGGAELSLFSGGAPTEAFLSVFVFSGRTCVFLFAFFLFLVCQHFEVVYFSYKVLSQGQLSRFVFGRFVGTCGVLFAGVKPLTPPVVLGSVLLLAKLPPLPDDCSRVTT